MQLIGSRADGSPKHPTQKAFVIFFAILNMLWIIIIIIIIILLLSFYYISKNFLLQILSRLTLYLWDIPSKFSIDIFVITEFQIINDF
jgi:hypothetical protein